MQQPLSNCRCVPFLCSSMSLFGWQNSTKMLRDCGCRRLRRTAYATSSVPPSSAPSPDSEAKCGNGNKSGAEHDPEEQVVT